MADSEDNGTDFAKNENGEALGTNNDARVSLLESIADSADREREDEFLDIVDLDKGTTEKFTAPAAKSQEDDEEAVALAADQEASETLAALAIETAEAEAVGQTPVTTRIKVNGADVELTPELISKAQKIASADVYLGEAARLRNELAAAGRQAAAEEVDNTSQGENLVALARAIQMGSEEEAVEALRQLQKAGPSQDDIARTVDERVIFNSALTQFRKDYSDIVKDPVLNKLALEKDDQLVRAGDTRPYYERFSAIGEEIRDWLKSKTGKVEPVVQVQSEKVVRKAAASGTPVTASAKTSSSVKEEKEESPSDIIRAMAAQRGGPQWMRTVGLEQV